MNATIIHRPRLLAVFALCLAAAIPLASCRFLQRGSLARLEPGDGGAGGGLAVAARFVTAEDGAPDFFMKVLPDSQIAAVRVAIRNDGAASLLVHSANGMDAGAGFDGFALVWRDTTYLPLHPNQVLARLLGVSKAGRYRKHNPIGLASSVLIPPLAAYLAYNEAAVGRFYRPLFNNSLHPVLEDGMLAPVRLEPSGERGGYLYFAIPKEARGDSCELLVRACPPGEARYSLQGESFLFSRDELPLADDPALNDGIARPSSSCDAPYGYLFALERGAAADARGLSLSRVRSIDPTSDSLWTSVTKVASKAATIADVSCIGTLAACGLNFKSKSKVYFMQCSDAPDVYEEQSFSRGIRRVILHTGGAFVLTDDGVCHPYDGASHKWRRGVKVGDDIGDVAFVRGLLLVFQKKGDLGVFGPSGPAPLARSARETVSPRVRGVIGLLDGDLALLRSGRATGGDTISIFDIGARCELLSRALPGRVSVAASDGSSLLMQFEEGTLMRVVRDSTGTLDVTEMGYLPFKARALKAAAHGFIAVGESGALVLGSVESVSPVGTVEASVRVR